MAARATMAGLIARVRRLIGDNPSPEQRFTDDEVQESLDRYRVFTRYMPLEPEGVTDPDGDTTYTTFHAPRGAWEADAEVVDGDYDVLTLDADATDYENGVFVLSSAQDPPVLLSGRVFDLYAAAADLMDEWADECQFDFTADGASFKRSQVFGQRKAQARALRAKSRPVRASLEV